MENELDLLMEKGWWFSVTPKAKDAWYATVYKRNPQGSWDGIKWKQLPTLIKAMSWIENYLDDKLNA